MTDRPNPTEDQIQTGSIQVLIEDIVRLFRDFITKNNIKGKLKSYDHAQDSKFSNQADPQLRLAIIKNLLKVHTAIHPISLTGLENGDVSNENEIISELSILCTDNPNLASQIKATYLYIENELSKNRFYPKNEVYNNICAGFIMQLFVSNPEV